MTPPAPDPEVAAVVLAAGESRRMGSPKLLLPWGGRSLVRRAAEAALGACRRVVVVVGAQADRMRSELTSLPVRVVTNPDYGEGIAASLRRGLQEVSDAPAVLVVLADQAAVTAEHLRQLVRAYRETGAVVIAASYKDGLGAPAVFARRLFPELMALRGDAGAKRIIERHRQEAVWVPIPEAAVDVDTPEDWQVLKGQEPSDPVP